MVAAVDAAGWTSGGTWPYEPRWFTASDGTTIHYVDEGPRGAQPVVMLHSNPVWAYTYRHFVRALGEAGFRAVAHDQMGFGRSDKPADPAEYTLERHARHFADLIAHLGLEGVTLVAHIWGGPIALSWAVDHADQVRRLVLFNTWTGAHPPDSRPSRIILRLFRARLTGPLLVGRLQVFTKVLLFKTGRELDEDARRAFLAPHAATESRAGVRQYPRLTAFDASHPTAAVGRRIEDGLSRLADHPVLICWPTKDRVLTRRTLESWKGRFARAEVYEIDAGHYIQEDAHEQVIPILLDFLRRT